MQDTYGPPLGKRLLLFVDDLNMPRVDAYGTQQPTALLKLFLERKGLYDRGKELCWKNVKDVQVLAAMGPPGGVRNAVDPRFISLFSAFEIQAPTNANLRTIYQVWCVCSLVLAVRAGCVHVLCCSAVTFTQQQLGGCGVEPHTSTSHTTTPQAILGRHFAQLGREDVAQAFGESLTDATLQLYSTLLERLPPTPSRFHYVFNLRDLSRVYEGLTRSCSATIQAPADFLRLWRNEVLRVFHDRLICEEDKAVFKARVAELVQLRWVRALCAACATVCLPWCVADISSS